MPGLVGEVALWYGELGLGEPAEVPHNLQQPVLQPQPQVVVCSADSTVQCCGGMGWLFSISSLLSIVILAFGFTFLSVTSCGATPMISCPLPCDTDTKANNTCSWVHPDPEYHPVVGVGVDVHRDLGGVPHGLVVRQLVLQVAGAREVRHLVQ